MILILTSYPCVVLGSMLTGSDISIFGEASFYLPFCRTQLPLCVCLLPYSPPYCPSNSCVSVCVPKYNVLIYCYLKACFQGWPFGPVQPIDVLPGEDYFSHSQISSYLIVLCVGLRPSESFLVHFDKFFGVLLVQPVWLLYSCGDAEVTVGLYLVLKLVWDLPSLNSALAAKVEILMLCYQFA